MAELSVKVIIDNIGKNDLCSEWGLSLYLEYRGRRILLDTGASAQFAANAQAMGVELDKVDFGVLSHAHYDHADGMETFFRINPDAPFYLRREAGEDCYKGNSVIKEYIGIRKGILGKYPDRIRYVDGKCEVCPGATLLPHTSPGLDRIGRKAEMYRRIDGRWIPDDFSHEQSLVLETERGLVVLNSCSHGGADNILKETAEAFPGKDILAMIGGFHLYETGEGEVRQFARRLRETGVRTVITGHCTGEEGFAILREELGEGVEQMYSGFEWEV